MSLTSIKDILINARQEAHRMRHYYVGVEHLFIALLEIKSGLTATLVSEQGLSPEYVIDAIRRKAGKGGRHRLWAGIPSTARADLVISIAQEIALEGGRQGINERDLLIAILDEHDSIPIRTLRSLHVDLEHMHELAKTRHITRRATQSFMAFEFAAGVEEHLQHEQIYILRRMFHGYTKIRIDTRLTGGYSASCLLVVTPIAMDKEDAAVVVKIGPADAIQDEAQRYTRYVKNTLPPLTARLEDRPVAPDTSDLAGVKYTFLVDSDGNPKDLRAAIRDWTGAKLGRWLHEHLYKDFGKKWWTQNRPYRFEVWQEYDWVLPPLLTLQVNEDDQAAEDATIIKAPIRRKKLRNLEYGAAVSVEGFNVYRVDKEKQTLHLAMGSGANTTYPYQIAIKGIDFEKNTYYRGEVVDRIIGTVWRTRDEQLLMALRKLEPDFDIEKENVSINNLLMPNPVKTYGDLLDMVVNGSICTIHGDLHLGNILVGPSDGALLIDFARTRDGHTLFDWANLEISILSELIVPLYETDWNGARTLLSHFTAINHQPERSLSAAPDQAEAWQAIQELRKLVGANLADSSLWTEYYIALALAGLRAMTWETMKIAARRVMYMVSALSMYELKNSSAASASDNTPTPDATDFITNSNA
jgi:hypothetical protein